MSGLTRRTALSATALVVVAASSTEVRATPFQSSVPAWRTYIQNYHYSSSALAFKRPEGTLIVEYPSRLFYFASPGKRLGRVYFAPDNMEVRFLTEIEVPATLLAAALALHTAHKNMAQLDELLEAAISNC